MSKLQKALGMLRSDHESGTAGSSDSERDRQVKREYNDRNLLAGSSRSSVRPRYVAAPGLEGEAPADYSIQIDRNALANERLLPDAADREVIAQQFRRIKRPVLDLAFGHGVPETIGSPNVIMMASALAMSGKTFCSLNLAMSIARERDFGAVLVDADVLKPNISRALGLENRVGLIDFLLNPEIGLEDVLVGTNLQDIVVVPAGQQHGEATELLASRRMKEFISRMSERFPGRAIIVDTPPLLVTNEAQVLAEHMGQIVLVIEAGKSTHNVVLEALNSLNRDKPINAILNKARDNAFDQYGGGGYGYYSAPQGGNGHE